MRHVRNTVIWLSAMALTLSITPLAFPQSEIIFTKITAGDLVKDIAISAGAMWGDYDNDGFLDLVSVNHANQRNRLFRNRGDGTFEEIMDVPIARDYGSSQPVLWFDYDNDGFLDLFVGNGYEGNTPERDFLYHNEGNENHWLRVDLQGTVSNRSGVGAKIEVITEIRGETLMQVREISTRGGWSGSGLQAHFGLGDATRVAVLLVRWPSGFVQELHDVETDQTLVVPEGQADQPLARIAINFGAEQPAPWGAMSTVERPAGALGTAVWNNLEGRGGQVANLRGDAGGRHRTQPGGGQGPCSGKLLVRVDRRCKNLRSGGMAVSGVAGE